MVEEVKKAVASLGHVHFGMTEDEKRSQVFRRSIYFVKDIRKGEVITSEHIRVIRPGLGLAPKFYDTLLGRSVRADIKRGTAAGWNLLT